MVHRDTDIPDKLGDVLKEARQRSGITVEEFARRVDKTVRYVYRVENEGNKPKYETLFSMIRESSADANLIFYPEREDKDSDLEHIIRELHKLDPRSLEVIKATAQALLDTATPTNNSEKQPRGYFFREDSITQKNQETVKKQ